MNRDDDRELWRRADAVQPNFVRRNCMQNTFGHHQTRYPERWLYHRTWHRRIPSCDNQALQILGLNLAFGSRLPGGWRVQGIERRRDYHRAQVDAAEERVRNELTSAGDNVEVIGMCVQLEAEAVLLDEEERTEMLEALGLGDQLGVRHVAGDGIGVAGQTDNRHLFCAPCVVHSHVVSVGAEQMAILRANVLVV